MTYIFWLVLVVIVGYLIYYSWENDPERYKTRCPHCGGRNVRLHHNGPETPFLICNECGSVIK